MSEKDIRCFLIVIFCCFCFKIGVSQEFRSKTRDYLKDDGVTYFELEVQGLKESIDCDFGLQKVCFSMLHL